MEVNGSKLYSVKSIIQNSIMKDDIKMYLTNRKSSTSDLSWGTSVLIELYYTDGLSIGDNVKVFDDTSLETFEILNIVKNYIIISMSSNNGINFTNYRDTINDKSYKVFNGGVSHSIKESNEHKVYKELNVKMSSLTPTEFNFGDKMNIVINNVGDTVVYDLSLEFYLSVNDSLSSNMFDLVINQDEYKPIIKGLKFVEKLDNYKYLVFKYPTPTGYGKVIFTPKSIETNYHIYPDYYFDSNIFFNVSSDPEPPIIYQGFVESCGSDIDNTTDVIDTYNYHSGNIKPSTYIHNYSWNGSSEDDETVEVDSIDVYSQDYFTNGQTLTNGSNIVLANGDITRHLTTLEPITYKLNDVILSGVIVDYDYDVTNTGKTTITLQDNYTGVTGLATMKNIGEVIWKKEFPVTSYETTNILEINGDITEWLWRQKILETYGLSNNKLTIKDYDYNVTTVGKTTISIDEEVTSTTGTLIFSLRVVYVDGILFLATNSVNVAKIYGLTGLLSKGVYHNNTIDIANYRVVGLGLYNYDIETYDSIFTSYIPVVNINADDRKEFFFLQ